MNTNVKKIWVQFGRSLVFCLFFVSLFLFGQSANASVVDNFTITSTSETITTTQDGTLMCYMTSPGTDAWTNPYWISLDVNNSDNSFIKVNEETWISGGNNNYYTYFAYQTSVTAGTHILYSEPNNSNYGAWYRQSMKCVLDNEVTSIDVLSTGRFASPDYNNYNLPIDLTSMADKYLLTVFSNYNVLSFGVNFSPALASSSYFDVLVGNGLPIYTGLTFYTAPADSFTNTFHTQMSYGDYGGMGYNIYQLNTAPPIVSTDYVQYNYSQGPAYINGSSNPVNWSIHYNVCDTGYPPVGGQLQLSVVDETGVYDIGTLQNIFTGTGPWNCQGDVNYTGIVDTGSYGTSSVKMVLWTLDSTSTVIQAIDSPSFWVTQFPEIIYSNGNINYGGPNPIIINTATSSGSVNIPFDFNVCAQDGWASSTFILENSDNNTLTDFATSTSACSGLGSISFPYGTSTTLTLNARIDLVSSSTERQILGNSFLISLQPTDTPPVTQTCNMPSYDVSTICDGIGSDTFGVKCGVKFALVASAQFLFYPSCGSLYSITNTFNKFKTAFPFNTYFQFTDTINTAIDSALVSTSTESMSIPFIRQTATSSEYYMLPVMSSTTISNTIGVTNYNTYQTTLGYIWWILVACLIFLIIWKV